MLPLPCALDSDETDDVDSEIGSVSDALLCTDVPCENCGEPPYSVTVPEIPTSPLPSLQDTNVIATIAEREIAHNAAKDAELVLKNIDKEIATLDRIIDDMSVSREELETRREEVEIFKAEHERISSPSLINKLTGEIITEIFLFHQAWLLLPTCLHAERCSNDEPDSFSLTDGPLVLTHICRYWRTISIGIPRLWTHIKFFEKHYGHSKPAPQLIDLWVRRACGKPLHVYIREAFHWQPDSEFDELIMQSDLDDIHPLSFKRCIPRNKAGVLNALISRLIRYCNNWEELHLASPNLEIRRSWSRFNFVKGRLPILRRLTLHSWNDDKYLHLKPNPQGCPRMDLFSNSPLLEEVNVVHHPGLELIPSNLKFPYLQLQKINIMDAHRTQLGLSITIPTVSMSSFLALLQSCPNLLECSMMCKTNVTPSVNPLLITHSTLKVLEIIIESEAGAANDTEYFFNQLALPALRELAFITPRLLDTASAPVFDFITRSPKLSVLQLSVLNITPSVVVSFVTASTSSLELFHLKIWNKYLDDILQHLRHLPKNEWPSRKLRGALHYHPAVTRIFGLPVSVISNSPNCDEDSVFRVIEKMKA